MKLVQVAHAITKGDAASNQIIAMDDAFKDLGLKSEIYSNKIDSAFDYRVKHFSQLEPGKDKIIIYHMTTGTSFTNAILKYPYPVALYYHNITPAGYFFGNAWGSFFRCLRGRYQIRQLQKKTFFAWSASEYSRKELQELSFGHTSVLPIVLNYQEYLKTEVNQALCTQLQDGMLNILIVGRVTPHKKQDEAIRLVDYYKRNISQKIRIIIVGNHKEGFGKKLQNLRKEFDLANNVIFPGKVSFADLCTYYRACDVVLSLSEHEGFCVPLVEGMIFDKPIVAYEAAAVPETVGHAGILLKSKNIKYMAETLEATLKSQVTLSRLSEARQERLNDFSRERLLRCLDQDISNLLRLWKELK